MTRKLAFISPVSIKIQKEMENKLNFEFNSIVVRYKHPVLYVERKTPRDKEYVYIYSGAVTYVLMKVKPQNLSLFERAITDALSGIVDENSIHALLATIELYAKLSHILDDIYYNALKQAKIMYGEYKFSLLYFDFELRSIIKSALMKGLAKISLNDTIYKTYLSLPEHIRSRLSLKHFRRIVMTEISIKNIVNALKKN